jgi:hypothetical protein
LVIVSELRLIICSGASDKVWIKDFIGVPVEMNVRFAENDAIIPTDRVLTTQRPTTVVIIQKVGLWIQVDIATRLNAGAFKYEGPVKSIRCVTVLREVAGCITGYIVTIGGK